MSQSSGPSANARPMKCEDKQEGDLYWLFEQDDLPFKTTEFAKFLQMVQAAEKEGDGKGYVSVGTLQANFTSPEWENLGHHDSLLVKFLHSNLFMDDSETSLVSIERLTTFGLLNCTGSLDDKIQCFTEMEKK